MGSIHSLNSQGSIERSVTFHNRDLTSLPTNKEAKIKGIALDQSVQFAETYVEVLKEGHIPLTLNPQIPKNVLLEMARALEASELILKDGKEILGETLSSFGSAHHILCSSGTTSKGGVGKSFVFDISRSIMNAKAHLDSIGYKGKINKRFCLPMPVTHSFGLVGGILGTIAHDHELYTLPDAITPKTILDTIVQYEIDHLYLTPSLLRLLNRSLQRMQGEIKAPKSISIGSSLLFREELLKLMSFMPKTHFYFTYGLTELGPRAFTLDCGTHEKPHQVLLSGEGPVPIGLPIEGVEYKIENETLLLRSPYQAKNLKVNEDRYYDSTDRAELQGNIVSVHGRMDFTIIKSGMNIYPSEVEGKLSHLVDLKACCLIPQRSEVYGQVPILVCEVSPECNQELLLGQIQDSLKSSVPSGHLPSKIIFREIPFPRTSMGKIKVKTLIDEIENEACTLKT